MVFVSGVVLLLGRTDRDGPCPQFCPREDGQAVIAQQAECRILSGTPGGFLEEGMCVLRSEGVGLAGQSGRWREGEG